MAMPGSGVVRILYLTYDGLTSLIGQSQVWPSLKGIAAAGHQFEVITFEQGNRFERIGNAVTRDVGESEMDDVVSRLDDILAIDAYELRERSRKIHDLPVALAKYRQAYDSIAAFNPVRAA
jgi:hypothetical protein